MSHASIAVILLAGGRGSRFGGDIPKQYCTVAGKPLICHTLQALAAEPRIQLVQPVIAADDCWFSDCVAERDDPFTLLPPVHGGAERALSMQAGLAALPDAVNVVAIHDAARATPSAALLHAVFDAALQHGAAIPGIAVHDTIKRVDANGKVLETLPRPSLMAVQTPQVMRRDWLQQAITQESERLASHTDDASLLEAAGFDVYISQGHRNNRKITTPADLIWLRDYLEASSCA
jgi:2-C-methyl-D-erythritol 4-phosphate cytidylyltransferase